MKALYSLILAGIVLFGQSCTGKKFDYQSAYKFKTPESSNVSGPQKSELKNLTASINSENDLKETSEFDKKLTSKNTENLEEAERAKTKEEILAGLSKREKKIVQKIEQKIQRKLEAKPAAASRSMDGRMYTGIIVGAAGLVLMILAGGTVGSIGALALLVGVILIVWSLLDP